VVDPWLIILIVLCAVAGYVAATRLESNADDRFALGIGLAVPLAVLGLFKYFDLFVDEVGSLVSSVGLGEPDLALQLVLPVGVSFYTFQTIGYVIDVRRGHVAAERNLVDFLLFVTFFPQLVAGPIERADHLLPQIRSSRTLGGDDALRGTFLIAQGLVKKVVIADSLAPLIDGVLALDDPSGPLIAAVAVMFAGQIYCDFSGYTDIARGFSRLLGFDLLVNFRQPYGSRTPAEFWARWHITLSNWFRDYVYIPLGGNRGPRGKTLRNLMVTMTLSGLWHGASLNFVLWGAFHGAALVVHRLASARGISVPRVVAWSATMAVVLIGWIMFRITDGGDLWQALTALVSDPRFVSLAFALLVSAAPYLLLLVAIDVVDRRVLGAPSDRPVPAAVSPVLAGYVILAITFGAEVSGDFIYFQF
jgi:alginate O-acetyltransferase complex protein AlgI